MKKTNKNISYLFYKKLFVKYLYAFLIETGNYERNFDFMYKKYLLFSFIVYKKSFTKKITTINRNR